MGTLDDMRRVFGEDVFDRSPDRQPGHNWAELCTCGHLDRYHSPSVGGAYRLAAERTQSIRGHTVTITTAFHGCVGALRPRGFTGIVPAEVDREHDTMVEQIAPTCPCEKFRPVVNVDRPNRYFNQRMPTDRTDPARHPFVVGIRAFRTHLSRRKLAVADSSWLDGEFERRFVWLDGARVCDLSRCTATDGVFPVFVDHDRSELRCAKHR